MLAAYDHGGRRDVDVPPEEVWGRGAPFGKLVERFVEVLLNYPRVMIFGADAVCWKSCTSCLRGWLMPRSAAANARKVLRKR
jgi:hypothetical protein